MLTGRYSAMLDANTLHPAFLRAALLWFAAERLFRPVWSADVLAEWRASVTGRFVDVSIDKINHMQAVMEQHFPDAMVEEYSHLINCLELPDPNDRHVLAAAIVGNCQGIITANLRDFPADRMAPYQMEVVHPDDFIVNIIDLDPKKALRACRDHRSAMANTSPTVEQYLGRFLKCGLVQAHARLSMERELL